MSHPHLPRVPRPLYAIAVTRYKRPRRRDWYARGGCAGQRGDRVLMQDSQQHNGDAGEGELVSSGKTNIPTDLLRTFVAICELGSFTKTANLLDLTQPAVSAHMRRLESMIGADLITKSLTGVVLT